MLVFSFIEIKWDFAPIYIYIYIWAVLLNPPPPSIHKLFLSSFLHFLTFLSLFSLFLTFNFFPPSTSISFRKSSCYILGLCWVDYFCVCFIMLVIVLFCCGQWVSVVIRWVADSGISHSENMHMSTR